MKKTILLFLIYISINCSAQPIFDILTNDPASNTGLSSFWGYDDFYFYENSKGVKNYFNRTSGGINFKSGKSPINNYEIVMNNWEFFLNDLNALEDRIKFESESFEGELNSKYKDFEFGLSWQYVKTELDYHINEFVGTIPFSFFQYKTNVEYKNLELSLNLLKGNETRDTFSNKITGYSTSLIFEKPYRNICFIIKGSYTNFSADFRKDKSTFCELNGIQSIQYSCFGEYILRSNISISGGISGLQLWQQERSFFNAEPFIGYYSLFFGSKTFIKKMDFSAILPFISYEHKFRFHRIPLSTSIDYYHIFANSDIIYTERIWLIPGIWPDDSTKHKLDINPDVDGIFRIQFICDLVYKKFVLKIIGSQLIPVDYSKITKPTEPPTSEKKADERGGTSFTVSIAYLF